MGAPVGVEKLFLRSEARMISPHQSRLNEKSQILRGPEELELERIQPLRIAPLGNDDIENLLFLHLRNREGISILRKQAPQSRVVFEIELATRQNKVHSRFHSQGTDFHGSTPQRCQKNPDVDRRSC